MNDIQKIQAIAEFAGFARNTSTPERPVVLTYSWPNGTALHGPLPDFLRSLDALDKYVLGEDWDVEFHRRGSWRDIYACHIIIYLPELRDPQRYYGTGSTRASACCEAMLKMIEEQKDAT